MVTLEVEGKLFVIEDDRLTIHDSSVQNHSSDVYVALLLVRYAMATCFRDTFTGQYNTVLFVTTRVTVKTYGDLQVFICLKKEERPELQQER